MALIKCKNCGNQVSDKAEKCPHCGEILYKDIIICEECGAEIEIGVPSCPKCGCPIGDSMKFKQNNSVKETDETKKSNIKKIIIAVVVVVAVVLGCIIIFGNGSDKTSDTESAKESKIEKQKESTDIEKSVADIYKSLSDESSEGDLQFTISNDSINFINDHPDFFPGSDNNYGAMSDYVNYDIAYKHLDKQIEDYDNKLIKVFGQVIDIQEMDREGKTLTYVHVIDDFDYENFVFIYVGKLKDVYKDNYIDAFLLPLDMVTFKNKSAEYTDAAFCAGAYVMDCGEDNYAGEDYY